MSCVEICVFCYIPPRAVHSPVGMLSGDDGGGGGRGLSPCGASGYPMDGI